MARHNLAAALGALGRGGDRLVGHLTPGEIVIPRQLQTPALRPAHSDTLYPGDGRHLTEFDGAR